MINILLYLIVRYVTLFPVALIPALTWAVYGLVATSLFVYYRPVGADYVFVPIALMYIYYSAYRRDGWGGLAAAVGGSLLGLIGAPIAKVTLAEVLAGAAFVFLYAIIALFNAALNFISMWSMYAFWIGFSVGSLLFVSFLFGFLAGFIAGMLLNGYSMYASFVTSASRQIIHKALHGLPPGVMALAALPASTFFAAAEVFVALSLIFLVGNYALGFLAGSMMTAIEWSLLTLFFPGLSAIGAAKVAADAGAYVIGMMMARAWHRLEGSIASPSVMFGAMVAYAAGFLSPAGTMALAFALLLSRRRGHEAYTWIAVALIANAFFYLLGLVPRAWIIMAGSPLPWTQPV